MTLRVLLVDDEALARLRLRSLIEALDEPASTVVGEAADAAEATALLQQHAVDAVLLDIRMPGRSGLQLADALRRQPEPPAVIFVSAHAEHALAAFELEATDYLTKPVRRDRLQTALLRVVQRRAAPAELAPVLVVSDRGRVLRVPLADVLYLRAELKYVTLRTAARSYVLDDALADLEQRLGPGFMRIHRSAVVACDAVRELARRAPADGAADDAADSWAVRVAATDEWLPVSRRQLLAVRQALAVGGAG
ncbi:MAG: LytTR family DNA-binding domain-containing protein [Rubrivivax sp.]|nr:LytTR family DNA-binding domain-containing protein [Rubrivivax sp.]